MSSPLRAYMDALRHFPFAVLQQPQHYIRMPGRDFTRRRSLFIERVVWLTVSLLKTTLAVELDQFFSWLGTGELSVTKSALVQARHKLLPRFFSDLFQFGVSAFYQYFNARRWKGFRLWATDGSGFRLPDAPGLGDAFGWHGNQHNRVPSARVLACFDLLNNLVTALQFHTRDRAEIAVAVHTVCQIPKDVLMVYDRAYGSQIIPFLHRHFGSNCVVRLRVDFSNTVNSCWQDIYSHFILYNLQTALHQPLAKPIRKLSAARQHGYKPNRNVSAGLLKRFVFKFCLRPIEEFREWLEDYYRQILQTLEPERPGKNKERRRRLMRGTERHVHEKNYRRAL